MKKIIRFVFPVLVLLMVVSCTEDEFLLKNKWQLREYRYSDGTTKKVDSVFYNFQKGSFMAICIDENRINSYFLGNYFLNEGELSIKLFEESVSSYYYNKFFGWTDTQRSFQVEEISSSAMRLNYEGVVSVFRKY
ncbi:hypothetical protein EZS27_006347 [termite gut metagenome]|uniref:Uncharacterized protein n=1 Tax=termite gut metagenome TaxID=433724 RepID=A0A5J4SLP0_9ZZZZ